jgi:hypothetical protein
MQVQQVPDPAQQAWAQQQAQLQAMRQGQQLPSPEVEQPQPVPEPDPAPAAPEDDQSDMSDQEKFIAAIEDAAANGVNPEDFLRQQLAAFNVTLQEARNLMKEQTYEQVVQFLGIDVDKINFEGREYVKEIYHTLQRTA